MKPVAVLLAEGFEEVEAITPVDFLRRAGLDVRVVGVDGLSVRGGHNIVVSADVLLSDADHEFDAVVLPGGLPGAQRLGASDAVRRLVEDVAAAGGLVAAICAAPAVVLGSMGFLAGKRYTCYPGFEKQVEDGEFSSERVVEDGNLITSRGPGTAAEFALALIGRLVAPEVAEDLRRGTLQPS